MFGEMVKHFKQAQREIRSADIVVVVGTSLLVYPFNELIYSIKTTAKKYIIDPELEIPTFDIIKEKATIGMKKLINELSKNE